MYKILLYVIFAFCVSIFVGHITYAQSIQDKWIDELHICENRDDVEKILDTNGKYSYGAFMFQLDTFWGFGKQYGFFPKDFTKAEARLLIHVDSLQRAIAKEMLEDGLDYHWKNCRDKKIGRRYPISGKNT